MTHTHLIDRIAKRMPLSRQDATASKSVRQPCKVAETAFDRAADDERCPITQLALDPARVRVWPGNARAYDRLSADNCRELINSIVAEGGQRISAVIRRVIDDPDHEYEVIAGTRRHFAISWLRANGYPTMKFIAVVEALDDEAAFRLADLENRARKDVSEIERARNYAGALASHYGGHQGRMAERLGISKGWLSKMLTVATVPDAVLEAFEDIAKVSLAALYQIAKLINEADAANAIGQEANTIAKEQGDRYWDGQARIPAPEVIRRLKAAALPPPERPHPYKSESRAGRAMLSVTASDRQGVTLRLHNGSGAQREEVLQAVTQALDWLDAQGKGLWP